VLGELLDLGFLGAVVHLKLLQAGRVLIAGFRGLVQLSLMDHQLARQSGERLGEVEFAASQFVQAGEECAGCLGKAHKWWTWGAVFKPRPQAGFMGPAGPRHGPR